MRGFATISAASLWLLFAPVAMAQDQPPSPTTPNPASSVSDDKVNAVAAAADKVVTLNKQYKQKLSNAAPADQQRIVDEANDALAKAVTDQGLSVDEYESIIVMARKDPGLRNRIFDRMQSSGSSTPEE